MPDYNVTIPIKGTLHLTDIPGTSEEDVIQWVRTHWFRRRLASLEFINDDTWSEIYITPDGDDDMGAAEQVEAAN